MIGTGMNSGSREEHEFRLVIAFFAAPLTVPVSLLLLLLLFTDHTPAGVAIGIVVVGAFVSYAGTFALGVPTYRVLRKRGHTAFWIAMAAGFLIGVVTCVTFGIFFALSLDEGMQGVRFALTDLKTLASESRFGGPLGAISGLVFWLIARPDRHASLLT
jgi:hypothetical protein